MAKVGDRVALSPDAHIGCETRKLLDGKTGYVVRRPAVVFDWEVFFRDVPITGEGSSYLFYDRELVVVVDGKSTSFDDVVEPSYEDRG